MSARNAACLSGDIPGENVAQEKRRSILYLRSLRSTKTVILMAVRESFNGAIVSEPGTIEK